eukprot:CAMPEP_0185729472 /NCGR_PEP_ID=MMETSP1171-20130828/5969_1 /TAXON_ID=374046 /ORGANISM="Helicotheca tamensis, Strain CCMP826" /LENGTH=206 /DNA_ID=CAMNT_0028398319 /DNA_START=24 /DNA_END=641 /DNA_ORIENTATION=+
MVKARSTHQTSAALSTFVDICGNLRAKSIKVWTNSCHAADADELLPRDKIIKRRDSISRTCKVIVPIGERGDMKNNDSKSGGEEEVDMTLIGSRKWKPPRKPTSFDNGEVAKFGSFKPLGADSKSKVLDQFTCLGDIIQDRLSNPENRRARTTLTVRPSRRNSFLLRVVGFSRKCPGTSEMGHILVEVEWYTYRGWHDKEPEKDLW